MKNKRGWIRIMEATIAILIVSSVLLVVYSRYPHKDDVAFQDSVFILQRQSLQDIATREDLRSAALNSVPKSSRQIDVDVATENMTILKTYLGNKIPNSLGYELVVCELGEACKMSGTSMTPEALSAVKKGALYVEEEIISTDLSSGYFPKKVKLYVWENLGNT